LNFRLDLGQLRRTRRFLSFLSERFSELAMHPLPLRTLALSIIVVLATTLGVAAKTSRPKTAPPPRPTAAPAMNFDGRWSVVIITDSGSCDRAYRYRVRISGGRIYYDGDSAAVINGQVDASGNVAVSLRYGQSTANGSGHLTESDGEGRWQGASSSAGCSGRWEAERR
jgi:hypothetical protein